MRNAIVSCLVILALAVACTEKTDDAVKVSSTPLEQQTVDGGVAGDVASVAEDIDIDALDQLDQDLGNIPDVNFE